MTQVNGKIKQVFIFRILPAILIFVMLVPFFKVSAAEIKDEGDRWTLENDSLSAVIKFDNGKIELKSFYNKTAQKEYIPQDGSNGSEFFNYNYRFLENGENGLENVSTTKNISANGGGLVLGQATTKPIIQQTKENGAVQIGERLTIPVSNNDITVELNFEIYKDDAGLRYQAVLTNKSTDKRLQITSSDVVKLDFPDEDRNLNYVYTMKWHSTTGGVDDSVCPQPSQGIKLILNRYTSGDGFYIAPEVNWKTQRANSGTSLEVMGKAFAALEAFKGDMVKVHTNPDEFKLVLFPQETFEYIAVNLNTFAGDIVDGKMAIEKHLRTRFQYDNTSTILNTNDWDWSSGKNDNFYYNVAIPKALEAGMDMLMFDDCWNTDYFGARDSVVPLPSYFPTSGTTDAELIESMKKLTKKISDYGFSFGLWYSMSGGYHNQGNDLADPAVQAAKKDMIQFMIDNYGLDHQMIDLTEFWVNKDITSYSHPTDNVYRKNVLTRNTLNEIVEENPGYGAKYTTEMDIYPSQGDRSNELLHIVNNGWTTSSLEYGEATGLHIYSGLFGHMPLDSLYFNNGKLNSSANMERFYGYMFSRNVKHGDNPANWEQSSIDLMRGFNKWRKSGRIAELTTKIKQPVYLGNGWKSPVAEQWNQTGGPFAMIQTSDDKETALMIATGGEKGGFVSFDADMRWLDSSKNYLVHDITMNDDGNVCYQFKGLYDYNQLRAFNVNLIENSSNAKAYWLQAFDNNEYQVIYADEFVNDYSLSMNGGLFTVNATGDANEKGIIFVYSKTENKAMEIEVEFNANGNFVQAVNEFVEMDNSGNTVAPREMIYTAADLHENGRTTLSGGKAEKVSSGNTPNASQYGLNFTSDSTNAGSYIDFEVYVPVAGEYDLQVASKINSNRGNGVWYFNGEKIKEWNQGSAVAEHIGFLELGRYKFDEPTSFVLRFEFVGGSKKVLNIDRFILTPVEEKEGEDFTVIASELHSAGSISHSNGQVIKDDGGITPGVSDNVINFLPSAVGDYIEFTIHFNSPGIYNADVASKVNSTGRGVGDWSLAGEYLTTVDQSAVASEQLKIYPLGEIEILNAGDYVFRLTAKDKIDKRLNIDRFIFTYVGKIPNETLADKSVYLPDIENVEGLAGTEFEIPVIVKGIGSGEYRSIEGVIEVPTGMSITDLEDAGTISGGSLSKGVLQDGKYRFAYINHAGDSTLSMTNPSNAETLLKIKVKLDENKTAGSEEVLKIESFTAKKAVISNDTTAPNTYISVPFDVTKASSKITISESTGGEITASAKVLYQGDGSDLIDSNKKAVSVVFTGVDANSDISFGGKQMYYSPQRSARTNQTVYVVIVDSSVPISDMNIAENYTINNTTAKEVVFGNTNNDSVINAQDALNVLDTWLRKNPVTDDKQILEMNVTCDERIDTSDALAVADYFVNGREFEVTVK